MSSLVDQLAREGRWRERGDSCIDLAALARRGHLDRLAAVHRERLLERDDLSSPRTPQRDLTMGKSGSRR
jgi:hypothetical protein